MCLFDVKLREYFANREAAKKIKERVQALERDTSSSSSSSSSSKGAAGSRINTGMAANQSHYGLDNNGKYDEL
jgi:hypothetical protein